MVKDMLISHVKRLDLIDTGKLLKSFQVRLKRDGSIDIIATTDYASYVNAKFPFMVLDRKEKRLVAEEVKKRATKNLQRRLDELLAGSRQRSRPN